MPHVSKEWEVPVGLTASQNSSIINCKTIYQIRFMSNRHERTRRIHIVATISHQRQASQTQVKRQLRSHRDPVF